MCQVEISIRDSIFGSGTQISIESNRIDESNEIRMNRVSKNLDKKFENFDHKKFENFDKKFESFDQI